MYYFHISKIMNDTLTQDKKYPYQFDPENVKRINAIYDELDAYELEAARKINTLKGEVQIWVKQLNIPWKGVTMFCLHDTQEILRTPLAIAECASNRIGVRPSREMKNNIATTLGVLFSEGKVGRITISGKTYYGLLDYFKRDRVTLKQEYLHHQKQIETYV